jgi:hypothetical protein
VTELGVVINAGADLTLTPLGTLSRVDLAAAWQGTLPAVFG